MSGFTLDQLCTDVGVSRRTFFNHFATKEDAVLGLPLRQRSAASLDVDEAMNPAAILSAVIAATLDRWRLLDDETAGSHHLRRAIRVHPELRARLRERAGSETELTAYSPSALVHASGTAAVITRSAITVVAAFTRNSVLECLGGDRREAFGAVLSRQLSWAAQVFSNDVTITISSGGSTDHQLTGEGD